jgi:ribosome-associated protein
MYADDEFEDDFISKSQLKRESEAQQAVGVRLIELTPDKLAQLDLPEKLVDALELARKLLERNERGALKRQKQYIGKLMRSVEVEPIEAKFAEWERGNRAQTAHLHRLEQWRERLLTQDAAVEQWVSAYPQTDIQRLRTLIRNAKKEQAASKPPKSSRELFKLLRDISEAAV